MKGFVLALLGSGLLLLVSLAVFGGQGQPVAVQGLLHVALPADGSADTYLAEGAARITFDDVLRFDLEAGARLTVRNEGGAILAELGQGHARVELLGRGATLSVREGSLEVACGDRTASLVTGDSVTLVRSEEGISFTARSPEIAFSGPADLSLAGEGETVLLSEITPQRPDRLLLRTPGVSVPLVTDRLEAEVGRGQGEAKNFRFFRPRRRVSTRVP